LGRLDSNFSGGVFRTGISNDIPARALLVTPAPGPNPCAIEFAAEAPSTGMVVGRLSLSGVPDTAVGPNGEAQHDLQPGQGGVPGYLTMLADPAGRTVIVTHSHMPDGNWTFDLAVYTSTTLTADNTYGPDGSGAVTSFETSLTSGTGGLNGASVFEGSRIVGAFYTEVPNGSGGQDYAYVVSRFADYLDPGNLPTPPGGGGGTSPTDPTCSSPKISSISPASGGVAGDVATIRGHGFGASADTADAVTFNGVPAQIQSWSTSQITALIPRGIVGPANVRVTCGATSDPIVSGTAPVTTRKVPAAPPVAQASCEAAGSKVDDLVSYSVDSNPGGRVVRSVWSIPASGKGKHRTRTRVVSRKTSFAYRYKGKGRSFKVRLAVEDAYKLTAATTVKCAVLSGKKPKHAKKAKKAPVSLVVPADLLFAWDSSNINSAGPGLVYLRRVVDPLLKSRVRSLTLTGSCDWTGGIGSSLNYELGLARANAVRLALHIPRGVQVRVVSLGATHFPGGLGSQLTAAGRAKARKVAISVTYNDS
jgi:outer membrane protein OmpA-like peptidoglycan-associated protein